MNRDLIENVSELITADSQGGAAQGKSTGADNDAAEKDVIPSVIISRDKIVTGNRDIRTLSDYDLSKADNLRYSDGAFCLMDLLKKTVRKDVYQIVHKAYNIRGVSRYSKSEMISLIRERVIGVTALSRFIETLDEAERVIFVTLAENPGISIVYKGNDEQARALDRLNAKGVVYNVPGTNNYCVPSDIEESYRELTEIRNRSKE